VNLANVGIELVGTQRSTLRNVTVRNSSAGTVSCIGLYMHAKLDEAGSTIDCAHNLIEGFFASVVSCIVKMDGATSHLCNCAHNVFTRLGGVFGLNNSALPGINMIDADNNIFTGTFLYRQSGGTGYGVKFDTRARANYFFQLESSDGGVRCEDPNVAGGSNVIFGYDRENGQPAPSFASSAGQLTWTECGSGRQGWHFVGDSLAVGRNPGSNIPQSPVHSSIYDAGGGLVEVVTLSHNISTGTPAFGLGSRLAFRSQTETEVDILQALIQVYWANATDSQRSSSMAFLVVGNGGVSSGEAIKLNGDAFVGASSPLVTVQNPGSLVGPTFTVTDASSNNVLNVTGSSLGFYNTAAVAQPASTSTTRQALARMGLIGAGGGSVANNRLTMTSTERMTLSSTSRLTILDFGTGQWHWNAKRIVFLRW
jgi:hypothetical protein